VGVGCGARGLARWQEFDPEGVAGVSDIQIIRPGDTVIVRLDKVPTAEMLEQLRTAYKDALPDVEFVFVGGVVGIDVYRPDVSS